MQVKVEISQRDDYFPNNGGVISMGIRGATGLVYLTLETLGPICRQLGYPNGHVLYNNFRTSTEVVFGGKVDCTGDVEFFNQCKIGGISNPKFTHSDTWVSGVICDSSLNLNSKLLTRNASTADYSCTVKEPFPGGTWSVEGGGAAVGGVCATQVPKP